MNFFEEVPQDLISRIRCEILTEQVADERKQLDADIESSRKKADHEREQFKARLAENETIRKITSERFNSRQEAIAPL